MPKAKTAHTTPTPAVPTPVPAALSITALGEQATSDRKAAENRPSDDFSWTLMDRESALDSMIASFPATTLIEAVHQLAAAHSFAGVLEASDLTASNSRAYIEGAVRNIHRVLLSVLPVVADAAGLTLDDLALGYVADYKNRHFAAQVLA